MNKLFKSASDTCKRVFFAVTRPFGCVRDQPMYCASMVVIVVAVVILGHFIYMALFPLKTIEVNSVEVVTTEVSPGDTFEYKMDWCSFGQHEVKVLYRMVDGFLYTLPAIETSTPPAKCYNSSIRSVEIPKSTPPGTYNMQVEVYIYLNSIRTEVVTYETGTFMVK